MKQRDLVIGLDFGSDSVRGVLVDTHGGLVATDSCPYPRWNGGAWRDDASACYRQHPLDYFEAMTKVVRSIMKETAPERVAAIALDTTGSTPSAVDANGRALALDPRVADDPDAMFVLWKDHTAIAEADEINRAAAKLHAPYLDYCGGVYSEEWFYAKVLRILRRAPKVAADAATFVECSDYLAGELAGRLAPDRLIRNRCAASHKALWNAKWQGLPPKDFLDAVDPRLGTLRAKLYTETSYAGVPIGTLTPEWAEKLGLDTGVVVGSGAMDAHTGAVGAGIRPGMLLKCMGTSGNDLIVADCDDRPIPGICGQAEGSILPGLIAFEAGQGAFGDVFAWFKRLLEYGGAKIDLRQLERDAVKLDGSDGNILSLDFFAGRRTPFSDPLLCGALTGLTLGSTAPEVYLALMRGVAMGTRSIHENYRANGLTIDEVRAIGGIALKSPLLMQIISDVLQTEINIVDQSECCALGAAIYAAVAGGLFPDIPAAQANMSPGIRTTVRPDRGKKEFYDQLYRRYRELARFEEADSLQRR